MVAGYTGTLSAMSSSIDVRSGCPVIDGAGIGCMVPIDGTYRGSWAGDRVAGAEACATAPLSAVIRGLGKGS